MQSNQSTAPAYTPGTTAEPVAEAEAALRALRTASDTWALFLDIDGTLVDLAETPDGVRIAPGLPEKLMELSALLGGALALVTGRSLQRAEAMFAPADLPIAGLHGAELRGAAGPVLPERYHAAKRRVARHADETEGLVFEDKGPAFALHYRNVPAADARVRRWMEDALAEAGPGFLLQPGKMVIELRPDGGDKGTAVQTFLAAPPFRGRRPLVIGDDITDEAMFRVANAADGLAIRIAPSLEGSTARARLPSPARLRSLLWEIV